MSKKAPRSERSRGLTSPRVPAQYLNSSKEEETMFGGVVLTVVVVWLVGGSLGAIINAKSVKEKAELRDQLSDIRRWLWENGFGVKDFNFEDPDTHQSSILSYESSDANKKIATVLVLIIYGLVGLKVALDGRRELRELAPLRASAANLEKKIKTFEKMSAPA